MIRTAETLSKQIEAAIARREQQPIELSTKDRILTILDDRMQKVVAKAAQRGANVPDMVSIEFAQEFGFFEGSISCQLAADVKRALNDAGYDDVSVFREMDAHHGEKRCVRIEVRIA